MQGLADILAGLFVILIQVAVADGSGNTADRHADADTLQHASHRFTVHDFVLLSVF